MPATMPPRAICCSNIRTFSASTISAPVRAAWRRLWRKPARAKDVVFVGHELTHFTRRFLISGAMDAVINQNARHEVINSLRMLANCHAGIDPADQDRADAD